MKYEIMLRDDRSNLDFMVMLEAHDNAELREQLCDGYSDCDVIEVTEVLPKYDWSSFWNEAKYR